MVLELSFGSDADVESRVAKSIRVLQNRARTGVPSGAAPLGWWMRRMLKATLRNLGLPLFWKVVFRIRRYPDPSGFCNPLDGGGENFDTFVDCGISIANIFQH
jgi:hypothetical protein